ncbi:putative MFS family arabinose efflux permease [Microbacterium phyllosphaerae]|nr:putative MFS family arabinose efflux permease [Microbacterium phyllosphaerae]
MSSEFLPSGLLPQMAESFDVSVALVGQLVTAFAAAVILTAAPLAVVSRNVDRKTLAVIALGGIVAANIVIALAPDFGTLVGARIGGGIAHGLSWSVAAAYAADLVPSHQLGRATAITAAGGSLAGVLGVPIGNVVGQALGWRSAFVCMAILGAIAMALVIIALPRVRAVSRLNPQRPAIAKGEPGSRPTASSLPGILAVCAIILLLVIGQTTFGTYMVPWLTDIVQLRAEIVPAHLLATGVAGFAGIWIVGRVADTRPGISLYAGMLVVLAANVSFALVAPSGYLPVFLTAMVSSIAFAGVPVLLQARMMRVASPRQRTIAAALQTTAFNIGIGGGAVVGGFALESFGLVSLPWVACGLGVAGLAVLTVVDMVVTRRGRG